MGQHIESFKDMDTKWLLSRLAERNKSIASLARAVGRDRAAMSRIVNGDQPFQLWMAPIVADELGVTPTELLSRTGEVKLPPLTTAPLVPWHSVGAFAMTKTPIEITANYERIAIPGESATLFAIRLDDDAMNGIVPTGSVVVVDYSEKQLRDGELGVFAGGGRSVLRRYRKNRRRTWLEGISEEGIEEQPLTDDTEIVGLVVSIPVFARMP